MAAASRSNAVVEWNESEYLSLCFSRRTVCPTLDALVAHRVGNRRERCYLLWLCPYQFDAAFLDQWFPVCSSTGKHRCSTDLSLSKSIYSATTAADQMGCLRCDNRNFRVYRNA